MLCVADRHHVIIADLCRFVRRRRLSDRYCHQQFTCSDSSSAVYWTAWADRWGARNKMLDPSASEYPY